MLCDRCGRVLNGLLRINRYLRGSITSRGCDVTFRHQRNFNAGGWSSPPNAPSKDFYKILGVKRDASAQDIKSAYYELSKLYHPDVNPANGQSAGEATAKGKFQEINAAYEILGNKSKRISYDRYLRGELTGSEFSRRDQRSPGGAADDEEDAVLRDLRRSEYIRKTYKYRGMNSDDPRHKTFDEYMKYAKKKFDEEDAKYKKSRRENDEPANPYSFTFKEYGRPFKEGEFTDFQREMIRQRQAQAQMTMNRLIRTIMIVNLVVLLILLLFS